MSRLEDLPPDLRAVLSLLLRQRKDYDEVAGLLHIERRAVRDRAQAALTMLAPRQARELAAEQRASIGDYMLGQCGAPERQWAREDLLRSAPARAWAEALAVELTPLATAPLPEIPRGESRLKAPAGLPSSRRAGALLLGAIAVVVIVVLVLVLGGGSGGGAHSPKKSGTQTSAAGSTSTGASSTSTATPKEEFHSTLTSPDPASKAAGTLLVLSESGKRAFYLQVTGLATAPSGTTYAVWLTGTAIKAVAIGVLPAANSAGRIEGGALLPTTASHFQHLIVTRETSQRPTHPGTTLLTSTFKVGSGK
jgi:hypothetical protein